MSKSHARSASTSSSTSASSLYKFIPSQKSPSSGHTLTIRQQPVHARVCTVPERDRRPIDPPPILRMSLDTLDPDEEQYHTQSPHYFMSANLVHPQDHTKLYLPVQNYLTGTIVSSLHRLKDIDNTDGAFFVFGDLAVKEEGEYRLLFTLFEIEDMVVRNRKTILSDVFTVFAPRHFPGPLASTFLSRSFSDQGVRMRIRKEHRIQVSSPRKRKQSEPEKSTSKRKLQGSPLSDDNTSEASANQEDRKIIEVTKRDPSPIHTADATLAKLPPMSYSTPSIPQPSVTLPNPLRNNPPLNVSIYREPIATFPLFQQVMPDIAQYHLSKSNSHSSEPIPRLNPDTAGETMQKRRQESCRRIYEYPILVDLPFDARHINTPNHPLFP